MPATPRPLTETERSAARSHAGLARAVQLIELGLRNEGVREWNFSLRGMADRELLAAADMACERAVWDRCINTSDRTRGETVFALQRLYPEATFVSATELLRPLRAIKSEDEIALMRRAGELTEASFAEVLPTLKHGMTELDLIAEVAYQLRRPGPPGPRPPPASPAPVPPEAPRRTAVPRSRGTPSESTTNARNTGSQQRRSWACWGTGLPAGSWTGVGAPGPPSAGWSTGTMRVMSAAGAAPVCPLPAATPRR